jgi:hypothetical protein
MVPEQLDIWEENANCDFLSHIINKINSRWIKDLYKKTKTVKLLEKVKTRKYLHDLGIEKTQRCQEQIDWTSQKVKLLLNKRF